MMMTIRQQQPRRYFPRVSLILYLLLSYLIQHYVDQVHGASAPGLHLIEAVKDNNGERIEQALSDDVIDINQVDDQNYTAL